MFVLHANKQGCMLLWVELCLSKRYIEVLTHCICEYDLIWKEGLCRHNQVKMRFYLVRMDSNAIPLFSYKKRKERHWQESVM